MERGEAKDEGEAWAITMSARHLLVLLLASCAYTPMDLRKEGRRVDFAATAPAKETAQCLARYIDDFDYGIVMAPLTASIREGYRPGDWEVRGAAQDYLKLFGEITPAANGAHVTIYEAPVWAFSMAEGMAKKCGAKE